MDPSQPNDADNLIAWIGVGLGIAALVAQWLSQRQSTRLQRFEARLSAYREIRRYLTVCIHIGEETLHRGSDLQVLLRKTEGLRNDLLEGRDSIRFLFGDDVYLESEIAFYKAHAIESTSVMLAEGSNAWRQRLSAQTGLDIPPLTDAGVQSEREALASEIIEARKYLRGLPAVFEPYLAQDRYAGVLWPRLRDQWKRTKSKAKRLAESVQGRIKRLGPRALSVVTRSRRSRSATKVPTAGGDPRSERPSPTGKV